MTHKITVGLQQKVGQPNYGSLGATCQIELSIHDDDARHAEILADHIRGAFACCRDRIDEQLSSAASAQDTLPTAHSSPPSRPASNGRTRPASEAQIRAMHAIASKQGVVLASELEAQFGVTTPAELTIRQASQMIDALKSTTQPGTAG